MTEKHGGENPVSENPVSENTVTEQPTTEPPTPEKITRADATPTRANPPRNRRGDTTTSVRRVLRDWLPTFTQMSQALQLQMTPAARAHDVAPAEARQPSLFDVAAVEQERAEQEPTATDEATVTPAPIPAAAPGFATADPVFAISMRQGMGLIVVTALLAGLVPFIWNWIMAVRLDTSVPLLELAQFAARQPDVAITMGTPFAILVDTAQTIIGVGPRGPVWLAAGLTALGEWINWPLRWLSVWIVYGLGVLVICLLLGATTTLQRFYALTSYAAIPLLLMGLTPIPCVGALAALAGIVWSAVMYGVAVRAVTGLDWFRVVLSILTPMALAALLAFLGVLALAIAWLQWVL